LLNESYYILGGDILQNKNKNEKFNAIVKNIFKNLNKDKVKSAVEKKDLSKVVKDIDPKDIEKLKEVLSDENKRSKILSTPQAQKILKQFLGE
jgi:hypothetical protein